MINTRDNHKRRREKNVTVAKPSLKIIGFCCQNALIGEQGMAGKERVSLEPTIKIVALPCSSKVETLAIMKGFESGADGIFVLGCPDGKCHLLGGNHRARKIVNYTKRLLHDIGIESDRLEMFQLGTPEWPSFDRVAEAVINSIDSLGKA
jgi:coenzyme F420-reducing hydrogenase delta subunit